MPRRQTRGKRESPARDLPPHQPPHIYLDRLSPEERQAFLAASTGLSLEDEIRLCRTVLATLAQDITRHHRDITYVMSALMRAIAVHGRVTGQQSDLEEDLIQAANLALQLHQSNGNDE